MLVLIGPLALRSADWYSVRLLAKPVVQPVTFAVAAEEGSVPVLVRTGEGVARAFATNAVPDGSFPLGSLVGIRRLDVDSSVRHVPERAFENAADLRVVSFEGRVRRIESRAFAGSTNLAAVVLHEATSVLVASNAFAECSRSLSCVYPFAPVMTAQDGAAQSGAPVFPRVRFLTGEALRRELSAGVDTSTVRKELRFYRSGKEWFADVPQHTQAENQMVAGADTLLDEISNGAAEVLVVLSSDIPNPDEWKLHLHLVKHDKFGATYKVRTAGRGGAKQAWLCNVMHTVFGGEHPTDIYIHSISAK